MNYNSNIDEGIELSQSYFIEKILKKVDQFVVVLVKIPMTSIHLRKHTRESVSYF